MSVSFQYCIIAKRLLKNPLRPDKGTGYIFDEACVRGSMATSTHKYYPRYGQAKVSYWPASQEPHNLGIFLPPSSIGEPRRNDSRLSNHDSRPAFWVLVLLQRQLWITVHSRALRSHHTLTRREDRSKDLQKRLRPEKSATLPHPESRGPSACEGLSIACRRARNPERRNFS